MDKIIELFISLIPDWLKAHFSLSRLLVVSAPACGLYSLWNYSAEGTVIILAACKGTEAALLEYKAGLLTFLFIFTAALLMARYSDKKFKIKSKEYFPEVEDYASKARLPIQTKIVESSQDGKWTRYIEIENNLAYNIDHIKGAVVFSRHGTIIFTVPFEVKIPIPTGRSYCVMDDQVTDKTYSWTTFSTYVETVSAGGKTEEGLKLDGAHVRRMRSYFILNYYNYQDWIPFVGGYELSWIYHVWKFHFQPWIQNFPAQPRLHGWLEPRLRYEIAGTALPVYAARLVRRPRAMGLESFTAIACEITSINYCFYSSLSKGAWATRARIGRRLLMYARRMFNQLIWLTVVGSINAALAFGFVSLILFIYQLLMLWGPIVKYGILALLKLQ